uniref:Uncharacterized protein n=1 Tax=Physcomitrium patens TaxID=3218 RepID=A0A2K1K873_PHYPA|nr:hypothetical protein PHYPA_011866 [Physcomitrium patens]
MEEVHGVRFLEAGNCVVLLRCVAPQSRVVFRVIPAYEERKNVSLSLHFWCHELLLFCDSVAISCVLELQTYK